MASPQLTHSSIRVWHFLMTWSTSLTILFLLEAWLVVLKNQHNAVGIANMFLIIQDIMETMTWDSVGKMMSPNY